MDLPVGELKTIFEAFGTVKSCRYLDVSKHVDVSGVLPDCHVAVVEYDTAAAAQATASGLNKFALSGRELTVEVVPFSRAKQLLEVDTSSFCRVVLQDMVSFEDTLDPGLKEEVSEEAATYGALQDVQIAVEGVSKEVTVTLLYAEPAHAAKALKALNGRAFGGKKIKAVLAP